MTVILVPLDGGCSFQKFSGMGLEAGEQPPDH